LTGALTALAAAIIVLAAVPPVDRDALTHHLAVPKLYLKYGGMVEIPHVPFSYYPMNLDLFYLVPLALGNDIAPKYIHFGFALLTAGLIFSYLRRRLESRTYGLLGALMFLSLPVIVKLSVTVYVDLGLIFFSTASLLRLLRWSETRFRLKHLVWAGIWAGLCLGTKPNGLLAAFLLAVTVPFLYSRSISVPVPGTKPHPREGEGGGGRPGNLPFQEAGHSDLGGDSIRNALKPVGWALVFCATAALVFSPWLVRNFLWTGNPVYPMAQRMFGPSAPAEAKNGPQAGVGIDAGESGSTQTEKGGSDFVHFAGRRLIFGESLMEIIAIPVRVFFQGEDDNPRLFDGRMNPYLLLFPLLTLLLFRGRNRPSQVRLEMRAIGTFALLHLLFAFFLVDMRIRYISPIIPPLVILAVFGIDDCVGFCRSRFSGARRSAGLAGLICLVAALLGLNGAYIVRQFDVIDPLSYLGGQVSRDAYIQKYRPEYAVVQYANRHLPTDARILLLFNGNRIYYLDREAVSSMDLFRGLVQKGQSPEEVLEELRRQGISHLLVGVERFNHWAASQFSDREKEILQSLFDDQFRLLFRYHGYYLFEIMKG
jgi:hypothetical protein